MNIAVRWVVWLTFQDDALFRGFDFVGVLELARLRKRRM